MAKCKPRVSTFYPFVIWCILETTGGKMVKLCILFLLKSLNNSKASLKLQYIKDEECFLKTIGVAGPVESAGL